MARRKKRSEHVFQGFVAEMLRRSDNDTGVNRAIDPLDVARRAQPSMLDSTDHDYPTPLVLDRSFVRGRSYPI
jgi:hypothetical protein